MHHVLFGCSLRSLPHICGKMRKVWCAQSTKEEEGRTATKCPFFFQRDSTTRRRQSMRTCGSMSDCLLTWTTSGWCRSRKVLTMCTILLNGSSGVGQGSGSILARHMFGTDTARSPQLAMKFRGEPKCWMKKHVCGQGQRFLLSGVGVPSGSRGIRAGAVGGHHRETVHCCKQSRACPTSSQHGCCCSIALRLDVVEQFARTHDASVAMPLRHFKDP